MQQTITPYTVHLFCRTCLKELREPPKYTILMMDVQIRNWLQDPTTQSPVPEDAYPKSICHLCRDKLESFLEFHQMSTRSRKVLQYILVDRTCNSQMQDKFNSAWKLNEMDAYEDERDDDEMEEDVNCDWLDFDFVAIPKTIAELQHKTCKQETRKDESNIKTPPPFSENDDEIEEKANADEDSVSTNSRIHIKNKEDSSDENSQWGPTTDNVQRVSSEDSIDEISSSSGKKPKRSKLGRACQINKYKFRCDQCHKLCSNQQTLDTHKNVHQGLHPHQCHQCHRIFHSARYLRVHLNEVHNKINIKCEYEGCGKEFRRTCTYRHHVRYKHIYVDKQKAKAKDKNPQQQSQHVCEECGKVYTQWYNLQVHLYSHKPIEEYPFRCPQCAKAFPCQIRLKRHQLTHSEVKEYECPHCGLKKRNKYALRAHINYHTKERQWNCAKCPMVFASPDRLRSHDKVVHLKLRPYTCSYCEQTFATSDALKHHKMRHTGEKPHICSECGKRFIQLVALRTHMKTHNILLAKRTTTLKIVKPEETANIVITKQTSQHQISEKNEDSFDSVRNTDEDECSRLVYEHVKDDNQEESENNSNLDCGDRPTKRICNKSHLPTNKPKTHKTGIKSKKKLTCKRKRISSSCEQQTNTQHVCEECGKVFEKLRQLEKHQYTHKPPEEHPFYCSECSKIFKSQQTFKEHQLRHSGIKNFECPYCGVKKTTKSELQTHLNYHTKERQYLCPNCPMIFSRISNFRRHDEVVHQGIRRYICRYCDQAFGKPNTLKHHEMIHTGEKPHACSECGKRFRQQVQLTTHMKVHNKQSDRQQKLTQHLRQKEFDVG